MREEKKRRETGSGRKEKQKENFGRKKMVQKKGDEIRENREES